LAGTGTDKLTKGLSERGIPYEQPYENLSELLSALKTDVDSGSEKESAGTEEIIVFSPGATSFGMFRNEFDRGNTFMAEVKKTFI
ncbi:MAG: UDP-N-acetylmuramoyl-L-alanine--D-glutamate ligase, partial [Treponema porcinum]|nr:UDP-N-acetylmuramoyl-L-alanine--D-glutamate ligase [Treponema porcinum]